MHKTIASLTLRSVCSFTQNNNLGLTLRDEAKRRQGGEVTGQRAKSQAMLQGKHSTAASSHNLPWAYVRPSSCVRFVWVQKESRARGRPQASTLSHIIQFSAQQASGSRV